MIFLIDDTRAVEGDCESIAALERDFRIALALPREPVHGFNAQENFARVNEWRQVCGEKLRQFHFQRTQQRRRHVSVADAFVAYLVTVHGFVEKPYETHHVF